MVDIPYDYIRKIIHSFYKILYVKGYRGSAMIRAFRPKPLKSQFRQEEIACIGDGENDLSMFVSSGVKIAMGNAVDKLKIQADHVVDTNSRDGAARAIEKYIL